MSYAPWFISSKEKSIAEPTLQRKALAASIDRLQQPLTLESIFQNTAIEVRQVLAADRVAVFQFYPDQDWEGAFVAEDVATGWSSVLAQRVHDHCFGDQFASTYGQGQGQVLADIHAAGLSACHIEILSRFQIKANVVVPILRHQSLWGLLCVHQCSNTREWQPAEIDFIQHISKHVGLAIQQSDYSLRAQAQSAELMRKVEQERALAKTVSKVRQTLEIDVLFQSVATEVRQLLGADRVAVFQFYPEQDWAGSFVSEDVVSGSLSVLEQRVYDHCFGEKFAPTYSQGRVQAVSDIHEAGLMDCHIEILGKFQVRANLVVPVLQGGMLWGLLCVHQCEAPRQWHEDEIEFVRHIAHHLSDALTQAAMLSKVREQANQQKALTKVMTLIRESPPLDTVFSKTTQIVRQCLPVDRVGIFRFDPGNRAEGRFIAEDRAEGVVSILSETMIDDYFDDNYSTLYQPRQIYVVSNLADAGLQACYLETLEPFQLKAYVIVPILIRESLWGFLCLHQCESTRQWQDCEVEFASHIAEQLGVALTQSAQLERLQNRQALVSATVDKIRQSLDLDKIFETTTYEVRQLLEAERVAIYRFNADWSGDFVAESIATGWLPLVGVQPTVTDTYLTDTQGGRYEQQNICVVDDIYEAGYADCHIALLEEFQARAYVILPLMVGTRLWGLLAAYQNSAPRHWESEEIELLSQMAEQLGMALKQSEALAYQKQQSDELQKATERQQGLSRTIDKIRRSLDIDTIFKTTTQEVRQLLEVDRVAIYRFNRDWSGTFVADSIVDGWQATMPSQTVIEEVFSQPDHNGKYPRNEVFVPISQGDKLWGLLMAYQTSTPRYWSDDEMGLLAQVGAQLGIALQQAELLTKTQQQTDQLNLALEELQRTQAQLVQGEKMVALGHLVAGIAHEINTPLGAIQASSGNMTKALQETLADLPKIMQQLNPQQQSDFFDLLNQALQRKAPITSREKRPLKKALTQQLKSYDLENARQMADRLVDVGIWEEIEPFVALLKSAEGPQVVQAIYNLSRTQGNNQTIQIAVERAAKIVLALKSYARFDQSGDKQVVPLVEGIETVLSLYHNQLKQGIEVIKCYEEIPTIWGYPDELLQVWTNLIHNAIQAMNGQGILEIIAAVQDEQVCVQMIDSGSGVAIETQTKIFDPFFTTKPQGEGSGLGLSISQTIIDKHAGRIEVDSQPGRTSFTVYLPLDKA